MEWLAGNWIWIAVIGAFVGMHLFGHRHGGHGAGGGCCGGKKEAGEAPKRARAE